MNLRLTFDISYAVIVTACFSAFWNTYFDSLNANTQPDQNSDITEVGSGDNFGFFEGQENSIV